MKFLAIPVLLLVLAACSSEDGTTETSIPQTPVGGSGASGANAGGPVQN